MQRLESYIEQERVHRGLNRAEVAHELGSALRYVRRLAELLGVYDPVI